MENAANLLLGAVLIIALVALSALVLLRSKRRRNVISQPGEPAAPTQTGLLGRLSGILRRGKKGAQSWMPGGGSALTDFGAMPGAAPGAQPGGDPAQFSEGGLLAPPESLAGGTLPEDREALLGALASDSSEELTTAEADAFRALTGEAPAAAANAEDSDGQSNNEAGSPSDTGSDTGSDEDKVFGTSTLDDALAGAFKTARIVDTKREALVARVPSVEIQDLADEIKSLATRIKVYIPDEPAS